MIRQSRFRPEQAFWSVPQVLGGAFLAVIMAYAFQGLIPVLNNDDVRQIQSPETMAMITQGRWLYYFLYNKMLDQNPLPGFSTFVGSACLVGAAWMHAKLIGLKHSTSVLVLAVVSSISIYYGYMFDFDSTRIAYPLGNLLSAVGLVVVHRSASYAPRIAGVLMLSLGPAFYPATVMYQVTLLVSAALYWCMQEGCSHALRRLATGLGSVAAGVVVYRVLTVVLYAGAGLELDDRGSLNPLGLLDNRDAIKAILSENAIPFIDPGGAPAYFSPGYSFTVLVIFILFFTVLSAVRGPRLNAAQIVFVLVGFLALMVSPFFLILFTETDYYPIRSLYSFAAVYGALLAISFERASRPSGAVIYSTWIAGLLLLVAGGFTFINAALVGQKSYDQSLAWQSDVAHVNRIIYRIDDVISDQPPDSALKSPTARIPLVVVGDVSWRSGPRGEAVSAWMHPWSKEYIFRLLDSRFVPAASQERDHALVVAANRQVWPSAESVFVDGGVVVVVR